ncbi:hypothetical protein COOONC_15393 [Cooperia oncophora]
MYLELTQKGIDERVSLVQSLLAKSRDYHLPVSVRAPFTMSLKHDISVVSSGLFVFGISLVCLFVLSIVLLGQPALTCILVFTSVAVFVETVGYATHWGVPMNVLTVTMAISANMLTAVVVMAFCYSYSVSGKQQMRAGVRIQYSFQATFLPVVFACLVPVITYLPLFAVDAPIVNHIFKILLVNSVATLLHYLFFLPNLCLLFSTHLPTCSSVSCAECCCDFDDESSIYYIPTTARAVHPEGVYQHTSYTYSVPQSIVTGGPPNYLAIAGPPPAPSYAGDYVRTHVGRSSRPSRTRRTSESSATPSETPRQHRNSRKGSRDDSIYEAPPSPRVTSGTSPPPQRSRQSSAHHHGPYFQDPTFNMHQQRWRPFVHPQPYAFYPQNGYRR